MLALWHLRHVVLLAFAAIVLAVLLRALAAPLARHLHISSGFATALAGLILLGVLATVLVLFGAEIRAQVTVLLERIPEALEAVERRLGISLPGEGLAENAPEAASRIRELLAPLVTVVTSVTAALANIVIILFGGVFLAAQPATYREGFLRLFPAAGPRDRARRVLDRCGQGLRAWLVGQLAAMVAVGTVTGLGLWAIGMESPLALGLIAGITNFVPVVGPIFASIPAILLALADSLQMAVLTTGLYILIQQLEGNLIMPIVQREAVHLPPALSLFAVVGFGLLFGTFGVLLATPLAVVTFTLVKQLYLRDTLGQSVDEAD
jgi:predicted PurR-regulated permease PerM